VHAPRARARPARTHFATSIRQVLLEAMNGTTPLEQASAQLKQAAKDACSIALARTYPDWNIWESGTGRWHATLRTPLAHPQVRAERDCAVEADDLDELATQIAEHDLPVGTAEANSMAVLCRLATEALTSHPRTGRADDEGTESVVGVAIQERRA
jgi:hypothetical protein